ncbi:NAD(P)/FAD-dependent oxidoreductase [Cetobacterium sp. SF1]|uniref:NAD(P)/FAD-dependent oxidoreductase n=1 Tax=unclassified Cetobacterium TaxID=2630983 RepID=UPI003CF10DF6
MENNNNIYDLIIVGAGPAGLSAAIYAGRANLKVLVLEKDNVGSLIMAHKIDNYPGFPSGMTGRDLYQQMKNQAINFKVEFKTATFLGVDVFSNPKIVKTDSENFSAHGVIIATGWSKNSNSKIPGEHEFIGKGVSYCATCDGAFTRGMTVSLFGKGEEVAEEALFLTRYAKNIQIFVSGESLQCNHDLLETLKSNEKISIILNAELKEISGTEYVEKAIVSVNGEEKTYKTDYAFLYLGTKSPSELYGEFAKLDNQGYILTDELMKTNIEGIFAAGDIRSKHIRQVTTATSDGTIAAMEAIKYTILKKKKESTAIKA